MSWSRAEVSSSVTPATCMDGHTKGTQQPFSVIEKVQSLSQKYSQTLNFYQSSFAVHRPIKLSKYHI